MYKKFESVANSPEITREEVKNLFNQLNPRDQLLRLVLILEMPRDLRPNDELTMAEQEEEVINWATSENGPGLTRLSEEIKKLIARQYGR